MKFYNNQKIIEKQLLVNFTRKNKLTKNIRLYLFELFYFLYL